MTPGNIIRIFIIIFLIIKFHWVGVLIVLAGFVLYILLDRGD